MLLSLANNIPHRIFLREQGMIVVNCEHGCAVEKLRGLVPKISINSNVINENVLKQPKYLIKYDLLNLVTLQKRH